MPETATLNDVIERLDEQNKTSEKTGKNLDKFIKTLERSLLDKLEDKKESAPKVKADPKSAAYKAGESLGSMKGLGVLLNPMKLLAPLLATVTAFGAGIAGLRGWEKKALTKIVTAIDDLRANVVTRAVTIADKIMDTIKVFTSDIFVKYFGFTAEGDMMRDEKGRFTGKAGTIRDQIWQKVGNLRTSIMQYFGFAEDAAKAAPETKGLTLVQRATNAMNTVLDPIKSFAGGVTDFVKGTGAGLYKFIEPFVKGAAKFGGLFSKILGPIGILFSVFDGWTAWKEGEGKGLVERSGMALGGILGDFVGAPFDLLKSGIIWLVGKLFGVESKDGKYTNETITGRILNKAKEFSIEETIKGLVAAPFAFIQKAIDWIGELFTDPKAALTSLWEGLYGKEGLLNTFIWKPVSKIIDWISEKFGWKEEGAPAFDLRELAIEKFKAIKETVSNAFGRLVDYMKTVPERIQLVLEEKWAAVMADLKKGFLTFGAWVSNIPNRIYANVLETLNNTVVGDYLVDDDAIAKARAAIDSNNANLAKSISAVDDEFGKKMAELAIRRAELEERDAAASVVTIQNNNGGNNSTNASIGVSVGGFDPLDPRNDVVY